MTKLVTTDDHLAVQLSSEVDKLCQPLFNNFPITFFNYVRIYPNGSRLSMSNRADWLMHYFEK